MSDIETDLKVKDYVRFNFQELSSMVGSSASDKIIIFNRGDTRNYVKMAELTLEELRYLSDNLYPCSLYKEEREDDEYYGKWILLLTSKPFSLILRIRKYAEDNWSDIKDSIIYSSVFPKRSDFTLSCPYRITFSSRVSKYDGLTIYTVYLDGVDVGRFVD